MQSWPVMLVSGRGNAVQGGVPTNCLRFKVLTKWKFPGCVLRLSCCSSCSIRILTTTTWLLRRCIHIGSILPTIYTDCTVSHCGSARSCPLQLAAFNSSCNDEWTIFLKNIFLVQMTANLPAETPEVPQLWVSSTWPHHRPGYIVLICSKVSNCTSSDLR